jgi:hypothetical protein
VAISSVLPFSDANANAADILGFDCDRMRLKEGIFDRSSDSPKFPSCAAGGISDDSGAGGISASTPSVIIAGIV